MIFQVQGCKWSPWYYCNRKREFTLTPYWIMLLTNNYKTSISNLKLFFANLVFASTRKRHFLFLTD